MGQELIDIGNEANDGTGDPGRIAFDKVNNNFTELFTRGVKYTSVTTTSYLIDDSDLIHGMNIFGINYPGESLIGLPTNIDSNKLVVIKDESGNAAVNNIEIKVSNVVPPTDFKIDSVTATTATLSWTPPDRGSIVGYLINVNGIFTINTPYETGNSIVIRDLASGTPYTMYMVSYDTEFISVPSNEDTATTL